MSENTGTPTPAPDQPSAPISIAPAPAQPRQPARWKTLAGVLLVGLVVGGGIGAGTVALLNDPTESDEYQALHQDLQAAERSGSSTERESSAPSSTTTSSSPASDEPDVGEVGQTVTNRGVTLTVTGAQVTEVIELNKSNYAPGSGYETYTPTPPDAGGKFIVVQTHIVNNAQVSMDLTCSYPIATVLVDVQDRQFDPIDSLHELRGNPECNDQLQPGFEADMTYVYMVPASAEIAGFAFADVTDFSNPNNDYTAVRLSV